jgi:flagellar hook assembly protein FlgD
VAYLTGKVQLFDHADRLVRTLKEGMVPAGYHEVRLDGRGGSGRPLASGIYFYRVKLSSATLTGRFTVLK